MKLKNVLDLSNVSTTSNQNSNAVALKLKKRNLGLSKRNSIGRGSKAEFTDAPRKMNISALSTKNNQISCEKQPRALSNMKPFGSLFQSQKDEKEEPPRLESTDMLIKGLNTSNVHGRGYNVIQTLSNHEDSVQAFQSQKGQNELTMNKKNQQMSKSSTRGNGPALKSGIKATMAIQKSINVKVKPYSKNTKLLDYEADN